MSTSSTDAVSTSTVTPAPAPSEIAIRVQALNHYYGQGELRKQVLFDNKLELARGEIVIMTGPSGSGKTTILTLIGALRTVQEGSISVLGRELSGLSSRQLVDVRRDIGFIFQAHNLFQSLTAMQNVKMAMELGRVGRREMLARGKEILTNLDLGHRLNYKPGALSGGQKQRVAIARALVNRPRLVLADEPTAALDKQSGRLVVDLLKKLAKEQGVTIMLVTHDNRILDVADRIVNMVDGRVISNVVVGQTAEICEFLRKVPLFAQLTPRTLSNVADHISLDTFAPQSIVIRQGDPGDKFYVIRSGSAQVTAIEQGKTKELATLTVGDFFGEAALMTGEPRNATIKALTPLEVYSLGKEDFQQVIAESASFAEELRRALFGRQ